MEKFSSYAMVKYFQSKLEEMEEDAKKFDKGMDTPGERLRVKLNRLIDDIQKHRAYIHKVRYYRDAWKVFNGQKNFIENREHKERKYGTVSKVAKLQVIRKCKL